MAKLVDAARSKKQGAVEKALDDLSSGFKVSGHNVTWSPPAGASVEKHEGRLINDSVKALEDLVKAGKVTVKPNGDVEVK